MPVPLSGGSTSNENAVFFVFFMSSEIVICIISVRVSALFVLSNAKLVNLMTKHSYSKSNMVCLERKNEYLHFWTIKKKCIDWVLWRFLALMSPIKGFLYRDLKPT